MRIGPIEFIAPPLVEGPAIMFYIPLPDFLHNMPFAMQYAHGKFGLPVTITVISTWFVIFVLTLLFKKGTKKLDMIPGRAQAFAESMYDFLYGVMHQMLGGWVKTYFSFLSTLFLANFSIVLHASTTPLQNPLGKIFVIFTLNIPYNFFFFFAINFSIFNF